MNCSKVGPISSRMPTRKPSPAGTSSIRACRLNSVSGNSVSTEIDIAAIARAASGWFATQMPQVVSGSPSDR